MSCAKKYGPGAVIISRESVFNRCTSFDYLMSAQSVSIGALNREMIDNTELRMNRGQSASFLGSQSEIAWEIQVVTTWGGAAPTTGLGALFWAAGRESNGKLADNSICGRSLQITRFDRDGLLCEVLNGCIVQSVAYSFSASDLCTITFSGVAASKWQFNGFMGGVNTTWPEGASSVQITLDGLFFSSYQMMGLNLPTYKPTGLHVKLYDNQNNYLGTSQITAIGFGEYDIPQITIGANDVIEEGSVIDKIYFTTDPELSLESDTVVSPADWKVVLETYANFDVAAQSMELSLETGLSFGDLTANSSLPSEIISANNGITGSVTMYLDEKAPLIATSANMTIKVYDRINNVVKITCNDARITSKPAYELAADSAASGDFEFQCVADHDANNGFYWN